MGEVFMAEMFARTNEDLPSIVRGMDVRPLDYILAVGGSGDQAFALLEYAQRVKAVDLEHYQVHHIREQAKSITEGDCESFWTRRGEIGYFDRDRVGRLKHKILFFEVAEDDIVNVCQAENGFNKVYLSNAVKGHPDELTLRLRAICQNLPDQGLIYASNGETIHDALNGSGFVLDEVLTARTLDENWHPIVLRKVA